MNVQMSTQNYQPQFGATATIGAKEFRPSGITYLDTFLTKDMEKAINPTHPASSLMERARNIAITKYNELVQKLPLKPNENVNISINNKERGNIINSIMGVTEETLQQAAKEVEDIMGTINLSWQH